MRFNSKEKEIFENKVKDLHGFERYQKRIEYFLSLEEDGDISFDNIDLQMAVCRKESRTIYAFEDGSFIPIYWE